jgi:hypothetical protein
MCPTFSDLNHWSADFYCSILCSSHLTRAWSMVDHRRTTSSTLIFVDRVHRVWSGSRHATNNVDRLCSYRFSLGYFPRTRDDTVEYSWLSSLPSPVNRSDDEYVQQSNRIHIERSWRNDCLSVLCRRRTHRPERTGHREPCGETSNEMLDVLDRSNRRHKQWECWHRRMCSMMKMTMKMMWVVEY